MEYMVRKVWTVSLHRSGAQRCLLWFATPSTRTSIIAPRRKVPSYFRMPVHLQSSDPILAMSSLVLLCPGRSDSQANAWCIWPQELWPNSSQTITNHNSIPFRLICRCFARGHCGLSRIRALRINGHPFLDRPGFRIGAGRPCAWGNCPTKTSNISHRVAEMPRTCGLLGGRTQRKLC